MVRQIMQRGRAWAASTLERLGWRRGVAVPSRQVVSEPLQRVVFGEFLSLDNRRYQLYEGYRDSIKASWRQDYWPTIALLGVRNRIKLTSEAEELVLRLDNGRTLPAPLEHIADVVTDLAERRPTDLLRSDIVCPLTGRAIVAARMTEREIAAMAAAYRRVASAIAEQYRQWSGCENWSEIKALETGCGLGFATAALADQTGCRSFGIDSASPDYRWIEQKEAVGKAVGLANPGVAARTRISLGDLTRTDFDSNFFDLIYSVSVLEHVHDLATGFREMARILKPGGIVLHTVDPFFSYKGGHASCTLDFPWGHVRLDAADFRRYVEQHRPHEADHAIRMFEGLFNSPRVPLREMTKLVDRAGLKVLFWHEGWARDHIPSSQIRRDTATVHPHVELRDLTTGSLQMVLTK